jgi:RNA ligase (TIGR02306 family)
MAKKRKGKCTIQIVGCLMPIPGADYIELATIYMGNGFVNVIVTKGDFNVGDFGVYFEIGSFIRKRKGFGFLDKSSYKKYQNGTEGYKIKAMRLRNRVSQGLFVNLNVLEGEGEDEKLGFGRQDDGQLVYQLGPYEGALIIQEGNDATHLLCINN